MSFSKISLYSVIFFGGISLNNQIIAMEEITESIKQELATLDQSIIALEKTLKPAKEQRDKDKEQWYLCERNREKTRTPDMLFKSGNYTMNCDDLARAYGAWKDIDQYWSPSLSNPKYTGYVPYGGGTLKLEKNIPTHSRLKVLFTKGSFYRYHGIKISLKKDKKAYNQFQDDLERGKRVKDLVYLQLLQEKVQKNNQQLQDRNSCLTNRS